MAYYMLPKKPQKTKLWDSVFEESVQCISIWIMLYLDFKLLHKIMDYLAAVPLQYSFL